MRVNIDDTDLADDQTYWYQGAPYTGEILETDRDGNTIWLQTVHEGIPSGPDITWYADGRLKSEYRVRHGLVVGTARFWHHNGQISEERDFDDRGQIVAVRRWDETGDPVAEERGGHGR